MFVSGFSSHTTRSPRMMRCRYFASAIKHKIQLAFRSCHALRERKLSDVRRILGVAHGVESNDETTLNLDKAVKQHLKESAETFPMGDVERQVANQVCVIRSFVIFINFSCFSQLLVTHEHIY